MTWLGGWRQWPSVWHGREVGLFAPAWTYLLKDTACFTGVGTGFLNCCHGISFVNSEKPRTFKTPIVSLARLLYASRTFLAERWQVSPGNRFPTKAAQSSYLFAAFFILLIIHTASTIGSVFSAIITTSSVYLIWI
jgi:hypothetical protein